MPPQVIPVSVYYPQLDYLSQVINKTQNCSIQFIQGEGGLPISTPFFEGLERWETEDWSHEKWMTASPHIKTPEGEVDLLASIFYLVNCMQEWNAPLSAKDDFGRFKFTRSLQKRFGIIEENLVQKYIDEVLQLAHIQSPQIPSSFFVSHDIDTVHGALFQDGFKLLKQKRIGKMMKVIFNEFVSTPAWLNMDQIQALNTEHGVKSTFFWLMSKGKGSGGVMNADYSLAKVNPVLESIQVKGGTNGLHKSSSEFSLDEEFARSGELQKINRYHFLKFEYPQLVFDMEQSALNFDASVGFAEHYGFRTNFGLPFRPFNPKTQKASNFLEVPLNLMDGTFHKYMKMDQNQIGNKVIEFYQRNHQNCVLSLLWHNTYFTEYKYSGFLKEYIKIMQFIKEEKIPTVSPSDLIRTYL